MNRISILAACATLLLAAVSCQIAEPDRSARHKQTITIVSGLENDGAITIDGEETIPETKTIRDVSKVLWTPGDAISIFYGDDAGIPGGSMFTSTLEEISAISNFEGEIDVITAGGEIKFEDTYFWGVYPYQNTTRCNGSSITFSLPSQQQSAEDTFSKGQWPTMGKADGLMMSFRNICCGYKFKVETEGITKVVFKTGSSSVAGTITVSMDDCKTPQLVKIANGSNTVTVTPEAGGTFKTDKYYYAVMMQQGLKNGVQITFYTPTSSATYVCNVTGTTPEYPSDRGKFKVMDNKDHGLSWEPNALPGKFSVSATKKVQFAPGNLQATVDRTGKPVAWKFADNQYDAIGKGGANTRIGSNAGDIDLFGWSTTASGYGVSSSTSSSYYSGSFVDWGGTVQGDWRTLSIEEWNFLLSTRGTGDRYFKYGVIVAGKTNCLVIAPDGNTTTIAGFYSEAAWESRQAAGFVCLPAGGYRQSNTITSPRTEGCYYSSSLRDNNSAYYMGFNSTSCNPVSDDSRYFGMSVRLVTDAR